MNKDLVSFLEANFQLELSGCLPDTESAYLKAIQKELAYRIVFLLKSDMDRLLNILYRIDISQAQTDEALRYGAVEEIAMDLSHKIILRQLKKINYAKTFQE